MENFKPYKVITDVRQSPAWAKHLDALGWKSVRTSQNINIEIRPTIFGALVKVQKPAPFMPADLEEIESICVKNKALFIKVEPYLGQDTQFLEDAGYVVSMFPMTPTATYYIDLTLAESELWNNLSHSGKYSINRARREGVEIKIIRAPNKEDLANYYPILKNTGLLKKFYVPPIKQIIDQARAFEDMGFLVTSYSKNGEAMGAKWYVAAGDTVLYLSGGTTANGRKDKSGYELLWQSILYFKNLGFKALDLEGKDDNRFPAFTKSWGGFSHFKEKFGGQAVEFPFPYVKYLNPALRFASKYLGFWL